ncbi:unnamed protein product [Ixodes persulcatus]
MLYSMFGLQGVHHKDVSITQWSSLQVMSNVVCSIVPVLHLLVFNYHHYSRMVEAEKNKLVKDSPGSVRGIVDVSLRPVRFFVECRRILFQKIWLFPTLPCVATVVYILHFIECRMPKKYKISFLTRLV